MTMIGIDMTGKVTLVTGAGGGIGGGIADVFAKAGSKVYVADLEFEDARIKAEQIKGKDCWPRPPGLTLLKKTISML